VSQNIFRCYGVLNTYRCYRVSMWRQKTIEALDCAGDKIAVECKSGKVLHLRTPLVAGEWEFCGSFLSDFNVQRVIVVCGALNVDVVICTVQFAKLCCLLVRSQSPFSRRCYTFVACCLVAFVIDHHFSLRSWLAVRNCSAKRWGFHGGALEL
jgi:hypothetical protein